MGNEETIELLGVKIAVTGVRDVLLKVRSYVRGKDQHMIFTPNPEMLVTAQHDPAFLVLLNRASLALPDGVGILFAALLKRRRLPQRMPGVDVFLRLCEEASTRGWRIFLLGNNEGCLLRAKHRLERRFPRLRIVGFAGGGKIDQEGRGLSDEETKQAIRQSCAQLLFVGFGAPKQEKWIAHALPSMPNVRMAMTVGGAFDYVAGDVIRAPGIMRALGLEWLFRLIRQPWRIGRITRALIVFSWYVITK